MTASFESWIRRGDRRLRHGRSRIASTFVGWLWRSDAGDAKRGRLSECDRQGDKTAARVATHGTQRGKGCVKLSDARKAALV